ncbi:probable serine/threonine-protein kinase DDB_G0277071 [Daktulosphaira vitifoliae]|uniref:probable serine/threonine-protein kinase DDB_G0277071 n=1 Tax=Daktulosphaira vitifoliae TaxID=58002 RepID=UPI0021AAE22E|nr:probable serine/threonine-protein kinase DDB_G0277071 [Daktulosphaira vitifoliae]
MSSFDLSKMVSTVDNLSTCLDIMLCCKSPEGGKEIIDTYDNLENLVTIFENQMNTLKKALVREKNARQSYFQAQLDDLKKMVNRCEHMIMNTPINSNNFNGNQQYNQNETKENNSNCLNSINNISMSPVRSSWNDTFSPPENSLHQNTTMSTTIMGQSKCQTSKHVLDIPYIQLVNNEEMNTVPKYMKGRLTSLNINVVIESINIALENKYEILRKSKTALKKKELDAYNEWKIQQSNVGQGQYFVTAEDITKYSETKVDKTTLNIIPILRHLKRLKESRIGGFIYYLPY